MDESEQIALRLRLTGRVQGVGFRYYAWRLARQRHLDGWVRNSPDGAVEIEAAGSPHQMAAFKQSLRDGPAGARVDNVEETVLDQRPATGGFDIVYWSG